MIGIPYFLIEESEHLLKNNTIIIYYNAQILNNLLWSKQNHVLLFISVLLLELLDLNES